MLTERILRLKQEKDALVLAHNYQLPEIQDAADFVGDSLDLSLKAAKTDCSIIVFCGVYFMAETAQILSNKRVYMPVITAGCPLANMADQRSLEKMKAKHSLAAVVAYINSSASIKAMADIVCTSANALKVVESLVEDEIIFLPDQALGGWVAEQTRKKILLWPGFCPTHYRLVEQDIRRARELHPTAKVLVHPECRREVRDLADAVLGTGGMLRFVERDRAKEYIIGTEEGLIYRLKKENPHKDFYLASPLLLCPNMKKTDLGSLRRCLEEGTGEIIISQDIKLRAERALRRMINLP